MRVDFLCVVSSQCVSKIALVSLSTYTVAMHACPLGF